MLSEEALSALAAICRIVEQQGTWLTQVRLIMMPLLPMAKGGFRTIGVIPVVQRLWARARRVEADEWERQHHRAYFAAGSGCSPIEIVRKQAAKQDAGVAQGEEAAIILDDLESF